MRARQYVDSLGDEADSKLDLGHGDKLDVTATTLLGGEHDMGTPEPSLPECLRSSYDDDDVDLDFSRRILLVAELGEAYLKEGLDSLCHEMPKLRQADISEDCLVLNLGRGPGVLQCILQLTEEQKNDDSLDKEKELRDFRDRLLSRIQEVRPAMPLQANSLPSLMCRSFQTISAPALREALTKEGVKYVYHYMWGMKANLSDYQHLDDASRRAHTELAKEREGFFSLLNLHDIGRSIKTGEAGIPLVWSYSTGRGAPAQVPRGQRGCASMRTFAQMPGLFQTPSGSVQTRSATVVQFNDITKFTMYALPEHVQRTHGKFAFSVGKQVGGVKRSLDWMRAFWDKSVGEGLATLIRIGRGLRLEARVQGKVTAGEAAETCSTQRVHDASASWRSLGQYQTALHDGEPNTVFYPVRFVAPEVMAAHALRVADAAGEVVKGRSTTKTSSAMKKALVDAYAASGRTLTGFRCTDSRALMRDIGSFWVFQAEAKVRDRLANMPPPRTLPARGSRPALGPPAEDDVPARGRAESPKILHHLDSEAQLSSSGDDEDDADEFHERPEPGSATWGEGTAIGDVGARRKRQRLGSPFGGLDGSGGEEGYLDGGGSHDDMAPSFDAGGDEIGNGGAGEFSFDIDTIGVGDGVGSGVREDGRGDSVRADGAPTIAGSVGDDGAAIATRVGVQGGAGGGGEVSQDSVLGGDGSVGHDGNVPGVSLRQSSQGGLGGRVDGLVSIGSVDGLDGAGGGDAPMTDVEHGGLGAQDGMVVDEGGAPISTPSGVDDSCSRGDGSMHERRVVGARVGDDGATRVGVQGGGGEVSQDSVLGGDGSVGRDGNVPDVSLRQSSEGGLGGRVDGLVSIGSVDGLDGAGGGGAPMTDVEHGGVGAQDGGAPISTPSEVDDSGSRHGSGDGSMHERRVVGERVPCDEDDGDAAASSARGGGIGEGRDFANAPAPAHGSLRGADATPTRVSSRPPSARFGLSAVDIAGSGTRFSRVARVPPASRSGGGSDVESESSRKRAAIEEMRVSLKVRKKSEFGQRRGLTWSTLPTSAYGKCGTGSLCADDEAVYEAVWDTYGGEWAKHVSKKKR